MGPFERLVEVTAPQWWAAEAEEPYSKKLYVVYVYAAYKDDLEDDMRDALSVEWGERKSKIFPENIRRVWHVPHTADRIRGFSKRGEPAYLEAV